MNKEMSALDAIFTRRSIRSYTQEPVSEKDVETIIRAGMYAPSAHNGRTWEMLTVTGKEELVALGDIQKYWRLLKDAPLCIACCAYEPSAEPKRRTYLVHNTCAAVENMLLAIHALGLGGVWLNASPEREHYEAAKKIMGIPQEVDLVAVIACGHPAAEQPPRVMPERYEPEKWHREAW